MKSKLITVVLCFIPFLLIILAEMFGFVVVAQAVAWKAQGIKEAPLLWQIAIDLSDFVKLRWFVWLPVYVVVAWGVRRSLKR